MSSRIASKLQKQAELMLAAKENPGARTAARDDGVSVGMRVRYEANGTRYGVVRTVHVRSIVVELSAAGLLPGGEDIVVRQDEIPFSAVREVLGTGRLAQPRPMEKRITMAPPREQGYMHCDFDDSAIYEVTRIKGRGLVALCRDHARTPSKGKERPPPNYEPVTFRFRLGLGYESWQNWPRPTEQQIAAAAAPKPKPVSRKRLTPKKQNHRRKKRRVVR